ncbi:hypothetical protein T484DRAFT_1866881 [Baffinella frigidus]|nr:hypothetical protein T484DRAFT_1866881 [Cryptophyta sp. CCMP2293]
MDTGVAGSTVEEHQIVSQADLMVHSVYSSHASYDIGLIRLQGSGFSPGRLDLMVHSVYSSHGSYDVGLIRIQTASSYSPVELYDGGDLALSMHSQQSTASSYSAVEVYDGGDLGVSDCDPINITMAGWGAWGPGAEALQVVDMSLVDRAAAAQAYLALQVDMSLVDRAAAAQAYLDAVGHAVLGFEEFPAMTEHFPLDADGHAVLGAEEFPAMTEHFPQGASPFACASDMGAPLVGIHFPQGASPFACSSDMGAPLVGIVVKTGKAVLLGLQNIGQSCHFEGGPAIFTSVARCKVSLLPS